MNTPDLWSLLTGLASLISLAFALNEKYEHWRKYIYPAAACFSGFAIGRLSPSISSAQDSIFIFIVFSFLLIYGFIASMLIKKGEIIFTYMIAFPLLLFALPNTTKAYLDANSKIPKSDLLQLAEVKEGKGDIDDSIKYFKMYRKASVDYELQENIDKKIEELKLKIVK